MIEDVEKFAMKVVSRRWDAGYQELLNMVNIRSLHRVQKATILHVHIV